MKPMKFSAAILLLLLALVMSLAGCATQSPPVVSPPSLPPPPAELMEPPKPGLWSENVQALFKQWQQRLMQPSKSF